MPTVHLFTFLARPLAANAEFGALGGAFVNAWVAEGDRDAAELYARNAIASQHWSVESLDEYSEVSRLTYIDDEVLLAYFEQAIDDGSCFLFHCWPIDAEDADED